MWPKIKNNKNRKISCVNPEFLAYPRGRQPFFNPHGDVDLLIFPSGRQKGNFFCQIYASFTQRNDIFFKKQTSWSLIHIFRNSGEINT